MTQESSNNVIEGQSLRALLAVSLLLAAGLCAAISVPVALLLGPPFLLFFVLSLGFFPGERAIERVASWCQARRVAHTRSVEAAPVPLDLVAKAGRRIAYALAVRPPPRTSN